MTIAELGYNIGLPNDGILCAQEIWASNSEIQNLYNLFIQDEEIFLSEVKKKPHAESLVLAVFLFYAAQQELEWKQRGLSSTQYFDTMRDLTIWYKECVRQTGLPGVIEWDWLLNSLKRGLVRLGRLQYFPRTLKETLYLGSNIYEVGSKILEIHIPADGDLNFSSVLDSLDHARTFFDSSSFSSFHCHSWLLSPTLKKLLPPQSNILQFQSLFQVYSENFSSRQAEERVFGKILKDVNLYPEFTTLQKNLKSFLLSGGKIGMGSGTIPFQMEQLPM